MLSEWLPFGFLGRPHGVTGEIAFEPFNRAAGRVLPTPLDVRLIRGDNVRAASVVACRPVHAGLLLRFAGIDTRDGVAALGGHALSVPRKILSPLVNGEFYIEDVVGCDAVKADGTLIGHVSGPFWNGAQDVLTIVGEDGAERLVPAVASCIHSFDPHARRLVVEYHE
jgi:16S rRNA processing protein RimM